MLINQFFEIKLVSIPIARSFYLIFYLKAYIYIYTHMYKYL